MSAQEETRQEQGEERREHAEEPELPGLARTVEALLFLSSDPLSVAELAEATEAGEGAVVAALARARGAVRARTPGPAPARAGRAAGRSPATPPASSAARRLLSRPRTSTLTPAQAETLAIVAYLQPISRPEITRIRGVSADSATATLLERGLIEEAGRSQFGAVLYRTTHAVPEAVRAAQPRRAARHRAAGTPPRRSRPSCASACCAPARRARGEQRS